LCYRWICGLNKINLLTFSPLLYQRKSIMNFFVHKWMLSKINKIQKTTRWPNITFGWILLVHQLLRRCINWSAFIQTEIICLRYQLPVDISCASEISNFNDWTFSDKNILWFQISVNNAFNVHYDKSLHYLLEDPENLIDRDILLLLVIIKEISFRAVLHYNL